MSATSNADVEQLQKLVLHNPIVLNLLQTSALTTGTAAAAAGGGGEAGQQQQQGQDGEGSGLIQQLQHQGLGGIGSAAEISHFSHGCPVGDKMLVMLALLKLGLLRKKVRGVGRAGGGGERGRGGAGRVDGS